MHVYDTVLDIVGRTPLLRLNRIDPSAGALILGKLEKFNPTGSVKDRAVVSMLREAARAGLLKPGAVIVEATSGNTGIALASAAAAGGYKAIIVMPDSKSPAKVQQIRALGAEVVFTPAVFGMKRAFAEARRIAARIPGAFVPDQSCNPANPLGHMTGTAREIWEDTNGRVDAFVAGVGTGGTLTGVGQYLREKKPEVDIIAVEPSGSPVLSGGAPGPHRIEGIGAGFVPPVLKKELIDRVEVVSEGEARETLRMLATRLGLLAGPSSGAAVCAALRLARQSEYEGKVIVTVLPDSAERYPSNCLGDEDEEQRNAAVPVPAPRDASEVGSELEAIAGEA
jgi:cysteine synthase A